MPTIKKSKYHRKPKSTFPIWGTCFWIIAVIALIFTVENIRAFLNFKEQMNNSDDLLGLFANILVFTSVGSTALAMAIIAGVIFLITIIVAIVLTAKGV